MELLEGETLRSRLDAGPIPRKQALDLALQIGARAWPPRTRRASCTGT